MFRREKVLPPIIPARQAGAREKPRSFVRCEGEKRAAKISLDPRKPLAYVPATLDRTPRAVEPVEKQRPASRACIRGVAPSQRRRSAGRQAPGQARKPALDACQPPVASGTAHKDVRRTVQSLPNNAQSAAPLGPGVFGGFFMRGWRAARRNATEGVPYRVTASFRRECRSGPASLWL